MSTTKTAIASVFDTVQERIDADPSKAIASYEVHSRQVAGLRSEVEARDFILTVDEPNGFGGADLGPTPVELILAAVASCQEITYRLYAERLGIPLRSVSVSVRGDIDLRGLYALDAGTRSGFRGLDITVELDSDAPAETLERLKRTVDAHCPVLDIIRNATPVLARRSPANQDRHGTDAGEFAEFGLAGLAG